MKSRVGLEESHRLYFGFYKQTGLIANGKHQFQPPIVGLLRIKRKYSSSCFHGQPQRKYVGVLGPAMVTPNGFKILWIICSTGLSPSCFVLHEAYLSSALLILSPANHLMGMGRFCLEIQSLHFFQYFFSPNPSLKI